MTGIMKCAESGFVQQDCHQRILMPYTEQEVNMKNNISQTGEGNQTTIKTSRITVSIGAAVLIIGIIAAALHFTPDRSFSIDGTWKNTGSEGFGQAQPGTLITFNDTTCNLYSPQDTYAFYNEDGRYHLDVTSLFFRENYNFTVNIINEDRMEICSDYATIVLERVG